MSKNISISEAVYRRLKREKGDRSFSEVIADHLDERARLADVTGQHILDDDAVEASRGDIERLSKATVDRLRDETG